MHRPEKNTDHRDSVPADWPDQERWAPGRPGPVRDDGAAIVAHATGRRSPTGYWSLVHNHTTSVMVAMSTFSVRSCSVGFLVVQSTFQDRAEFFTFRVLVIISHDSYESGPAIAMSVRMRS